MASLLQDIRHALRGFAHARGFTAVAVATLALGIGANSAIFTLAHAVLLEPLGFPDEQRLVRITSDLTIADIRDAGVAVPELDDYRASSIFASVAGLYEINANLTGSGIARPERIEGLVVSPEYFEVLGVRAALGRVFGPADASPGIAEVAVITHGMWTRLFNGDRSAVGRSIRLDTDVFTIIGVLPAEFHHPGRGLDGEPVLFAPSRFSGLPFRAPDRAFAILDGAIGRLRGDVSLPEARDRLAQLGAALSAAYPPAYVDRGWRPRIEPLREALVGSVRSPLVVLLAAVAAVLLIACANVAGLLVARNAARQHEFVVRRALGASSGRLARQLLTESLLLGVGGGVVGLLAGAWMTAALVRLVPQDVPRTGALSLDGPVLLFTFALAVGTGVLFGLLPAWHLRAGRAPIAASGASRSTTAGRRHTRARHVLVVAEIAVALVLLVAAALLLRSFGALTRVNPGFDPDGVLAARIWLPLPNDPSTGPYFAQAQQRAFYRRALADVRAIGGVASAAWASWLPLGGERRNAPFFIEGRSPVNIPLDIEPFLVSDGYFETMRIPVLRGRAFTPDDDEDAANVLVISESLAKRYFPDSDPIGQRMYRDLGPTVRAARYTIVGVVGNVHTGGVDEVPPPQLYRSVWQWSDMAMVLMTRASGPPAALEAPVRDAVSRIDPDLPLFSVRPMADVLAGTLATRRFATVLVAAFSILALLLACIGIYGVVSYLVEQRRNEIGIRVALGASPRDILGMIVTGGLMLAAAGVGIGAVGALATGRLLRGLLYGTSPLDPAAFGATAILLLLTATGACVLPARRASRVDPVAALRQR